MQQYLDNLKPFASSFDDLHLELDQLPKAILLEFLVN